MASQHLNRRQTSETPTPEAAEQTPPADGDDAAATPDPASQGTPTPSSGESDEASVLLIDDGRQAVEGEQSEASVYLQILQDAGIAVDSWSTSAQGFQPSPPLNAIAGSSGAAQAMRTAGRTCWIWLGSWSFSTPAAVSPSAAAVHFLARPSDPPTVIADAVIVDDIPELVARAAEASGGPGRCAGRGAAVQHLRRRRAGLGACVADRPAKTQIGHWPL